MNRLLQARVRTETAKATAVHDAPYTHRFAVDNKYTLEQVERIHHRAEAIYTPMLDFLLENRTSFGILYGRQIVRRAIKMLAYIASESMENQGL